MEITTAYYDDTHAKAEWQKAREKPSKPYMLTQPDRVENERLLDWRRQFRCRHISA